MAGAASGERARRPLGAWLPLVALGGSRAAAAGLGALAMLVTAHLVSPTELGLWSMALGVQGYALHASELGLRSVVTAESSRTEGGAPALLPGYLRLRLIVAGLVYAAILAGCSLLRPDQLPLIAIAVASVGAIALQLDWVPLTRGDATTAGLLLLARPLAFLACLVAWPGHLDATALAWVFLGSWLAAALVSWRPAGDRGFRGPPGAPPLPARQMLALGWPLALVTLLNQLQLSADLLTVGATVGLAAAGQYYLAAGIATAALVLANARGQLALATMARFRDDPAAFALALASACREIAWLGTILTLAIGLVAVPLLPLVMGARYAPASHLLLWLLPWLLLQHVTTLLQSALVAARGQRTVLRANLVMTLALAAGLPLAALTGLLPAFAAVRAMAEGARLAALIRLAPPGRVMRVLPAIKGPLLTGLAGWALLLLLGPH